MANRTYAHFNWVRDGTTQEGTRDSSVWFENQLFHQSGPHQKTETCRLIVGTYVVRTTPSQILVCHKRVDDSLCFTEYLGLFTLVL